MLHTSPPVTTVRKHSSSRFEVKSTLVPLRHIILYFCEKSPGISSANEKHMYQHCKIVIKNIWWWRVVNPTLIPQAGGQPIVGSSKTASSVYRVGLFYHSPEHCNGHRMFWRMQAFCAQWDVRRTTGITATLYIWRPFLSVSEERPCCGNERFMKSKGRLFC